MTPNQFISKLQRIRGELGSGLFLKDIVREAHLQIAKRIFEMGYNMHYNKIGKYISPQYKLRRLKSGRQVDYVDYVFRGDLYADFLSSLTQTSEGWVSGVNSKNELIVGYLNERYGDVVFKFTETEKQELKDKIAQRIKDMFK